MREETKFKAWVVREKEDKTFSRALEDKAVSELPEGEVLIKASFAGLNFKDALSATGNKGVTRNYPHTPGIDVSGVVAESSDNRFKVGDNVLVTGYDLGMNTDGGFGEYVRVPAGWVIPLPDGLSLDEAMIMGTGAFTAALMVRKLIMNDVRPEDGDVVVTGATGGVGSMAVAILSKLGYSVFASTGKQEAHEFLKSLGAKDCVDRSEIRDESGRPMLRTRWAAGVDTVGGETLTSLLKTVHAKGSVTCCGLVESPKLEMTVFPFILRGVNLLGVDSAETKMELRKEIWSKLSGDWKPENLQTMVNYVKLEDLDPYFGKILKGEIQGRIVVKY
ncbi:alcohol dehydrogenase [Fulvitalea axinellae]|uniref:Alcohol dehydrogenase n=1 Tax=Fulvitalea axinellae TaxID=1182444 RepID=A0AAU9CSC9_9BACT|nr:alcohol dehydrogenase [Fulvitalea axinellae]